MNKLNENYDIHPSSFLIKKDSGLNKVGIRLKFQNDKIDPYIDKNRVLDETQPIRKNLVFRCMYIN